MKLQLFSVSFKELLAVAGALICFIVLAGLGVGRDLLLKLRYLLQAFLLITEDPALEVANMLFNLPILCPTA